jgi:hypothetical protein
MNMINQQDYKGREIEFQMDDVDDNVYFEGCDEHTLTDDFMTQLMEKIRGCKWFIEGNKTEGTITFQHHNEFTIIWRSITMGEDWDSDEEELHTQDVLLNMDNEQYEVVNFN